MFRLTGSFVVKGNVCLNVDRADRTGDRLNTEFVISNPSVVEALHDAEEIVMEIEVVKTDDSIVFLGPAGVIVNILRKVADMSGIGLVDVRVGSLHS